MQIERWCRTLLSAIAVLTASCLSLPLASAQNQATSGQDTKSQACPNDDSGLKVTRRLLRDCIRRRHWPRPPPGRGAERSGLRQHLVG